MTLTLYKCFKKVNQGLLGSVCTAAVWAGYNSDQDWAESLCANRSCVGRSECEFYECVFVCFQIVRATIAAASSFFTSNHSVSWRQWWLSKQPWYFTYLLTNIWLIIALLYLKQINSSISKLWEDSNLSSPWKYTVGKHTGFNFNVWNIATLSKSMHVQTCTVCKLLYYHLISNYLA